MPLSLLMYVSLSKVTPGLARCILTLFDMCMVKFYFPAKRCISKETHFDQLELTNCDDCANNYSKTIVLPGYSQWVWISNMHFCILVLCVFSSTSQDPLFRQFLDCESMVRTTTLSRIPIHTEYPITEMGERPNIAWKFVRHWRCMRFEPKAAQILPFGRLQVPSGWLAVRWSISWMESW